MLKDFKKLIKWSLSEFSDLPWRKNRNLYRTLVSEIMLQQTTVGTVINHYSRFLKQYPTLKSLASSSEEELLIAWKGLGYYRRAKNLLKACIFIHDEMEGRFPQSREKLLEIPGVGPYTASALMAIGKDEVDIAVDANLERVLARYYGYEVEKGLKLQKFVKEQFDNGKILKFKDKLSFRNLNESLMDLGRQYCRAKRADCMLCPLNANCVAYESGKTLSIPYVSETKKKKDWHELELIRFIIKDGNKILAYKKKANEWLSGQYEIPTFVLSTTDKKLEQYPKANKAIKNIKTVDEYKTTITKYKIKNKVLISDSKSFQKITSVLEYEWLSTKQYNKLSTASSKALKKMEDKNQEEE